MSLGPRLGFRTALAALLAAAACAPSSAETISGLTPLAADPDPAEIKPGLAVKYYFSMFRRVFEIQEWAKYKDGTPGEPLRMLNYRTGAGEVLTSGSDDGVGADIRGMIHFAEAGDWVLAMQSNDGVRLEIGGKLIINDPTVHADRFSELITVQIAEPGWYPLSLWYFERKNTSTLELYWLKPGEEGRLSFVPAEALAHVE
jgi:hypothetical protein